MQFDNSIDRSDAHQCRGNIGQFQYLIQFLPILLLLLAFSIPESVRAEPALLQADTYIDASKSNKNYGDKNALVVDGASGAEALLRFDLSMLGGIVSSAVLTLDVSAVNADGSIDFIPVTSAWDELLVTYNIRPVVSSTSTTSLEVTT